MSGIFIVAGDPSGDAHGADLIRALKRRSPDLRVCAVGGPLMRGEADEFIEDLASRGITGFFEPLISLGFFWKLLGRIKRQLALLRPAAVIAVDYYGFNRRVLSLAKSFDIPAYYYVSPQVWASRSGRVKILGRLIRKMFVIFPFEEELYRRAGVPCLFVGHPLLDRVPLPAEKNDAGDPLRIGILPGSRASEVRRHLPVLLEAVERLGRDFPRREALVFAAPSLPDSAYQAAAASGARVVRETGYTERSRLDIALCSSGTATLENALLGVPMIVIYRLSWPTYAVARALIRVPYISMANLLAGKALVPELIQGRATGANVAAEAKEILENPNRHARVREELLRLRQSLGNPGAAARAAGEILQDIALPISDRI
ncbi:MAG: lipid-A-disaccharide synthase [Elusimicrobiota bacterium]